MAGNKYTGEVPIDISGKSYVMKLDWQAIAKIQSDIGPDALRTIFINTVEENAKIIHYALAANHPDITLEDVLKADPALPIIQTNEKLDDLACYAYFGPDGPPQGTDTPISKEVKKKLTSSAKPSRSLSSLVSRLLNSGR